MSPARVFLVGGINREDILLTAPDLLASPFALLVLGIVLSCGNKLNAADVLLVGLLIEIEAERLCFLGHFIVLEDIVQPVGELLIYRQLYHLFSSLFS